jgi:hypothetical protein
LSTAASVFLRDLCALGGERRLATENTEDTEKQHTDVLTERIVCAGILEIKAVFTLPESPNPPLRSDCLFNFSESRLVDGIKRISP